MSQQSTTHLNSWQGRRFVRWLESAIRWLLVRLYKVEVRGAQHFDGLGERVMIVANHSSFLDGLLLYLFLPFRVTFAINTEQHASLYVRAVRRMVAFFPLDPINPLSIRRLIQYLQQGGYVVIFPEGRITVTGALMKIYNGPGLVATKTRAQVLPVSIQGAQYTPFSRLKGMVRLRWFPKITLSVMPPRQLNVPDSIDSRQQREYAGKLLSDIMTDTMFRSQREDVSLFERLLDARNIHGGRHVVVEDIQRLPLNYNDLVCRALLLGQALNQYANERDYVGVLMPNAASTVVCFWGLIGQGRVPAMLNFSIGSGGLISACETAAIKVVVTSRLFAERGKLDDVIEALAQQLTIVYLEDLAATFTTQKKLKASLCSRSEVLTRTQVVTLENPNLPAVLLFTSGSESKPKGVLLSHRNLITNIQQLTTRIDFNAQDVVLNALPMFHSFGLTGGVLLPVLSGMKTFLYPSPLHYRVIPEVAYEVNASILFGTNTFLAGYAEAAHPYDFFSVRYVIAGAEKLKDDVRQLWQKKFGLRLLEAYGATECSPGIASNTAMEYREDSVGRLLPGMECRLEPVSGLEHGGRLHLRGPNVMLGYLLHDRPAVLVPPSSCFGDGWYDSGDIVFIDDDGFIFIEGRAKRFAKIAGEMISLSVVETLASQTWPGAMHVALTLPDERKGEQVVLLTTQADAERGMLIEQARGRGVAEIVLPKAIVKVTEIPVLASGKIDYLAAQRLLQHES